MSENDNDNEEYNNYVRTNGIWKRLDIKLDQQIRTEILDRVYTRTRERIKEKGGMVRHEDALQLVLTQDKENILNDMLNARLDVLSKEDPLLADAFRNEETRAD